MGSPTRLRMTQFHRFCVSSLLTLLLCRAAGAEDWPTYMHDNARSGITAEELALPLSLHWQITPPAPHKPAWPGPQKGYREQKKLVFDDSFATVVVGGTVYFGSSVDSRIYAIDAATGKTRWSFATGGAVRLAPSVDSGKVYAGSDDGYAYCLEAESGKLIWQVRAGPDGRMVLGHGRLVSPWPVRTGVTIEDGKAWFGGGIFSFDGVRLHCVDAATGKPIWQEELPSALSYSAQGHWLLDSKRLYTPAGRSVPFAFDKTTGKKLYRVAGGKTGAGFGTYGLLHDDLFISGTQIYLVCYDADTGKMGVRLQPALRAIIARDVMFLLTRDSVRAVKLSVLSDLNAIDSLKISSKEKRAVRVTKMQENTLWKVPGDGFASMIMAGRTLVVGGTGEVIAFDVSASHRATPAPPQVSWKGTVTGAVSGLTAANSVLLASMSDGAIACFGRRAPATEPAPVAAKPAVAEENAALTGRAVALLKEAGAVRGHCLLVGKAAAIAGALAKNSELQVQCSVKNATAAQQLRQALAVQGVYGNRVTVAGDARIQGRYPQYFANIIVVEEGYAQENVASLLKPHGGTLFALAASGEFKLLSRREGLEGAGEWTHQYADPGNSGASTDTALSLPLSLLWYGDPGSNTQQERHSRGPAPLVVGGRVYLQCVAIQTDYRRSPDLNSHYLICFDAYNGVEYWRRELPGANRRYLAWEESNLACDGASLFVAAGDRCYRLDTQTGKTLATYRAPAAKDGSKRLWSYVAVSEGVLVGSTTKTSIFRWMTVKTESYQDLFSDALFAFDITTGKQLWHHRGANIKKNATAISEGMVFLADAGAVDEKRGASLWEEQLDVMAHKTMDRKGNRESFKCCG